jgi:hypothetical protein
MEEVHLRFSAIKLWLDDFVDGAIAFNKNSEMDTDWIDMLVNTPFMCPEEPMDHIIASLIHTKCNTIGGDVVQIARTHFFCDTSRGFSNAVSGDTDDWLPSMQEWMNGNGMHEKPWWHRPDVSTIDIERFTDEDVDEQVIDFGGSLVDMIRADSDTKTEQEPTNKSAEIIKPAFKPRIVNTDDD